MSEKQLIESIERKYLKGPHKAVRPSDAATIILMDRRKGEPRLLMGRRNDAAKFMPGVFVFPGGRVEVADGHVPHIGALSARDSEAMAKFSRRTSDRSLRTLALAAIRETFEETGLRIGVPAGDRLKSGGAWRGSTWGEFVETGLIPSIDGLHFLGRAITPPGRNRRFDTRFFLRDISDLADRVVDRTTPDSELVELRWVRLSEADGIKTVEITQAMLGEIRTQAAGNFAPGLLRPLYRVRGAKFEKALL